MRTIIAGAILLGGIMVGSAISWAGTVFVEEDLYGEERSEGRGVHFSVIRDGDLSGPLEVNVRLSESGNMTDEDGRHTLIIPAEHDLGRLDVWTIDDEVQEQNSTISFRVLPGTGYTIGSPSSTSVLVTDNDVELNTTDISAVNDRINEGQRATFRISRTGDLRNTLPLQVGIESDSLVDFEYREVSVTIPAGRSSVNLSYATKAISEDGYIFAMILYGNNENVDYFGDASIQVINSVADSLSTVSFVQATDTINEGNRAEFVIERDPATSAPLTVHYSIAVGSHTNIEANTPTTGSVTIPAWSTSQYFSIQTVDDGVYHPDGSVTGRLRSDSAYRTGNPSTKRVTVRSNESFEPNVTLSLLSNTVTEGGTIRFRVDLDAAAPQEHTVEIYLQYNGNFFPAGSEVFTSVTIPTNQRSVIGSINTVSDRVDEYDGSVEITLAADHSQRVTATITDDDLPSIRFINLALDSYTEGKKIGISLERSGIDLLAVTARVRVDYQGFSPTRQDIDVPFVSGQKFTKFFITLPDNTIYNSTSGRFRMTIVGRDGYILGSNVDTGWMTVKDDDLIGTTISVSAPSSVMEGSTVTFTFTRSAGGDSFPIWATHQIGWSDTGGWWPVDNEGCYKVVFPRNSTTARLRVPIQNDPYDLDNTRIIMRVSNYVGCAGYTYRASYSVGSPGSAEVRIEDNDTTNNPPQVYLTSASEVTEGQDIVARIHRTGSTSFPLDVEYIYTSTGDRVSDSRGRRTFKVGESSTDITIRTYRDAAVNESNTVTVELYNAVAFQWGHPSGKSSPAFILHPTRDTSRDIVIRDTGAELAEVTLEHIGPTDTNGNLLSRIEETSNIELRLSRTRVTDARIRVGIKATQRGGPWLAAGAKTYWFDLAPNETTKDIEIDIENDTHAENNGWVKVELLTSDNYNVAGTLEYTVNLEDKDPYFLLDKNYLSSVPHGNVSEFEVQEGNDAEITLTVVNPDLTKSYVFEWQTRTIPFSAVSDVDFAAQDVLQEVVIPAGSTKATIKVKTFNDYPLDDDNESFRIAFRSSNLSNGPFETLSFKWPDAGYRSASQGLAYTVKIRNEGTLPKAWVAEYGHASGTMVVDAIAERLKGDLGNDGVWIKAVSQKFGEGGLTGELEGISIGADIQKEKLRMGMAISANKATGQHEGYELEGHFRGIYPYAQWQVQPRLALWGIAGYSIGTISVEKISKTLGTSKLEADLNSQVLALGIRSDLIGGDDEAFDLTLEGDGTWIWSESEKVAGMSAAKAKSHRYRSMITGEYEVDYGDVQLTPSFNVRVERHGGDITDHTDTVFGIGMGVTRNLVTVNFGLERSLEGHTDGIFGLKITNRNLQIDLNLSHGLDSDGETDIGGSISYDRNMDKQGLVAQLKPEWSEEENYHLIGRVGYGFIRHKQGLITPFLELNSQKGQITNAISTGVEWNRTNDVQFELIGKREQQEDIFDYSLMARFKLKW